MIRVPSDDSTPGPNTFGRCVAIIDRSGAVALLDRWRGQDTTGNGAGGAPRRRPGYNTRAVLVLLTVCAVTGRPLTLTAAWGLAWAGLDPAQLADLGLDALVDDTNRAVLLRDQAAANAEYERFRSFAETRLYDPVDPSPHRRQVKRRNIDLAKELAALPAEERERLARNAARLGELLNALLAASVHETDPRHWKGDLACDGHKVAVARAGNGTGARPHLKSSYDPDARITTKHRRLGIAFAHEITVLTRVHRAYGRTIAQVAIGIAIGPPSSGDPDKAIEALDHAIRNGLARSTGRGRRELVVDQGYSVKTDFARRLLDRGYALVMQQPRNRTDTKANARPGARPDTRTGPTGRRKTLQKHNTTANRLNNGAWFVNGVALCEGGWRPARDGTLPPLPLLPEHHDQMTDEQFLDHRALEQRLLASVMVTNGRPRPSDRGAAPVAAPGTDTAVRRAGGRVGRPPAAARPDPVLLLQLGCPAAAEKCRCPRLPQSLALDPATHPTLSPPDTPPDEWPHTCTRTWSTAAITPGDFKKHQRLLTGTWQHADVYGGARSRTEAFFSQLTGRWNGGLTETSRHAVGTARVGIAATLAVIATNLRMQDSHRTKTNHNGGEPPWDPRRQQADDRERRHQALLRKRPQRD